MKKNYGVYFSKDDQKWVVSMTEGNGGVDLAKFDTWDEAIGRWKELRRESSVFPPVNGVSWCEKTKRWVAYYKKKHLGSYGTEELAKSALEREKGV